jgi:hypothetical protein
MDRIVAANQKGKTMKATDLLAILLLSALLSACASYQAGGSVQSGVQALLAATIKPPSAIFKLPHNKTPTTYIMCS